MAAALTAVPGVSGVTLGGSRARGGARPDSDWDLGVYYREPLSLDQLGELATRLTGQPVEMAPPGEWGRWSNGGAWLTVDGRRVDWMLRDLDRVDEVWQEARQGRYEAGHQPGRPLGFWSVCYLGELVTGRLLADPGGELTALRQQLGSYPEPLRQTLIADTLWEARFTAYMARTGAPRADVLFVALCLSRAVGVLAQALLAAHRRWPTHEKGSLEQAGRLPGAPAGFTARATALLAHTGGTPTELTATVDAADTLIADTRASVRALRARD